MCDSELVEELKKNMTLLKTQHAHEKRGSEEKLKSLENQLKTKNDRIETLTANRDNVERISELKKSNTFLEEQLEDRNYRIKTLTGANRDNVERISELENRIKLSNETTKGCTCPNYECEQSSQSPRKSLNFVIVEQLNAE